MDSLDRGIYDINGFHWFSLTTGFLLGFMFVNWVFALSSAVTFIWVTLFIHR